VGFKGARSTLIRCLRDGDFDHENRGDILSKNLLFAGKVTVDEVIEMAIACTGLDHQEGPHDNSKIKVLVHTLTPRGKFDGWYIKFYIPHPHVIVISVHK
jgi:hypothetical protein